MFRRVSKKTLLMAFGAILCIGIYSHLKDDVEILAPYAKGENVDVFAPLSAREVNAFIGTWQKYMREGKDAEVLRARNSGEEISCQDSPHLIRWLERRGWNPDRFFYIEERLRVIVVTIMRDEQILKRHKVIVERMSVESNRNILIGLKRVADRELQRLNIEHISSSERQLVEPRLKEISSLFE